MTITCLDFRLPLGMNWRQIKLIYENKSFRTETTGSSTNDRLCQIAFKTDAGTTVDELFNPDMPISVEAMSMVEPPYEVEGCSDSARMGGDDQDGIDWDRIQMGNGWFWSLKHGYAKCHFQQPLFKYNLWRLVKPSHGLDCKC